MDFIHPSTYSSLPSIKIPQKSGSPNQVNQEKGPCESHFNSLNSPQMKNLQEVLEKIENVQWEDAGKNYQVARIDVWLNDFYGAHFQDQETGVEIDCDSTTISRRNSKYRTGKQIETFANTDRGYTGSLILIKTPTGKIIPVFQTIDHSVFTQTIPGYIKENGSVIPKEIFYPTLFSFSGTPDASHIISVMQKLGYNVTSEKDFFLLYPEMNERTQASVFVVPKLPEKEMYELLNFFKAQEENTPSIKELQDKLTEIYQTKGFVSATIYTKRRFAKEELKNPFFPRGANRKDSILHAELLGITPEMAILLMPKQDTTLFPPGASGSRVKMHLDGITVNGRLALHYEDKVSLSTSNFLLNMLDSCGDKKECFSRVTEMLDRLWDLNLILNSDRNKYLIKDVQEFWNYYSQSEDGWPEAKIKNFRIMIKELFVNMDKNFIIICSSGESKEFYQQIAKELEGGFRLLQLRENALEIITKENLARQMKMDEILKKEGGRLQPDDYPVIPSKKH